MPNIPSLPRLPRLPLVPDPLRRSRVPRDLESVTSAGPEEPASSVGMGQDGVERIWESAVELYRSGVHPALQLTVRRHGAIILDRAIGHARGNGPHDPQDAEKVAVTTDTPFCVFSTSKAITATVVHLLDERGALHIGDRVCDYIPEYAAHGKDAITIAQVLSHRAGVPNLPRSTLDLDRIGDHEHLTRVVCDAKPFARPGKRLSYHAVSGGFILAEVVRRATGRGVDEVLRDEILRPLGFRWTGYGVAEDDIPRVGLSYVTGPPTLPPVSTLLTRALSAPVDEIVDIANDPRFLRGVVPSANVVTTGNELSRFFEMLRRGGELDGVRVLDPRTVRRALSEQAYLEFDFTLGFPTRFSMGFMLGSRLVSLLGPDTESAFGHLGFTNIMGWADQDRGISVGLITSGKPIVYPEVLSWLAIMWRIGSEIPAHSLEA